MTAGSPEQRGRPAPHRAAVGAVAGSAATMVMSAVMAAARAAGMLGEAPPRILAHQAAAAGGGPDSRGARDVLAVLAHLGFGAMGGAVYGLVRGRVPHGPGALAGVAWGLLIWTVSYRGWIPALGLLPPPSRDRPGRPTAMIAAHVVYGAVLGALTDRWGPVAASGSSQKGLV